MVSYLYVVGGDRDSEEAIRILEKSKISFKKIVIDKHANGKSMFRDIETTQTPSLATQNAVHVGLNNIKSFVCASTKP